MLVDDEPAALRRMARLCAEIASIEVVSTAESGEAALALLDRQAVDLLFLDIQMPGMTGLELAAAVARRPAHRAPAAPPAIVFVTAHERFAISAFSVDAVGYLLKPVDPQQLRATLDRLAARDRRPTVSPEDAMFWVPHRGALIRLEAGDIDYVVGEDDYVRLHRGASSYLIADRLFALAERLAPAGFVRVHRSILVNERRIAGLVRADAGWAISLADDQQLPVGRTYLTTLRARLGF